MSIKGLTVVTEQPNPEVRWATCCEHSRQGGFLFRVVGKWLLFRVTPEGNTWCDKAGVAYCRGCMTELDDTTPAVPWEWGKDEIDGHLRQVADELAESQEQIQ